MQKYYTNKLTKDKLEAIRFCDTLILTRNVVGFEKWYHNSELEPYDLASELCAALGYPDELIIPEATFDNSKASAALVQRIIDYATPRPRFEPGSLADGIARVNDCKIKFEPEREIAFVVGGRGTGKTSAFVVNYLATVLNNKRREYAAADAAGRDQLKPVMQSLNTIIDLLKNL